MMGIAIALAARTVRIAHSIAGAPIASAEMGSATSANTTIARADKIAVLVPNAVKT